MSDNNQKKKVLTIASTLISMRKKNRIDVIQCRRIGYKQKINQLIFHTRKKA